MQALYQLSYSPDPGSNERSNEHAFALQVENAPCSLPSYSFGLHAREKAPGLALPELSIKTTGRHQLIVGSLFNYFTLIEHD